MGIQVISFHCILKNRLGRMISSTFNREIITRPAKPEDPLIALATGLQNIRKGEKRSIFLRAEQAYGFYDPQKVISRSRDELPNGEVLNVGDQVVLNASPDQKKIFRVTDISNDQLVLDANHPLAGQDLIFEIEAIDAREATPEEILEAEEQPAKEIVWH